VAAPEAGDRGAASYVGVIPALNAASTLGPVVAGALHHLPRVLVVDDGSTDATSDCARAAGAEVVRHEENRGKGAALATAFEHLLSGPPFEAAVTLDADGQHDPKDIPALVERHRRGRPALIVGSRDRQFASMWGPRRAMNRFSSASLRLFTGIDLPDSQSGFRVYDAAFLRRLRLAGRRYEAEMEALMRAAEWRLPVASVPIELRVVDGRSTSHYRPLGDTLRIVGTVLRHWTRRVLRPSRRDAG